MQRFVMNINDIIDDVKSTVHTNIKRQGMKLLVISVAVNKICWQSCGRPWCVSLNSRKEHHCSNSRTWALKYVHQTSHPPFALYTICDSTCNQRKRYTVGTKQLCTPHSDGKKSMLVKWSETPQAHTHILGQTYLISKRFETQNKHK